MSRVEKAGDEAQNAADTLRDTASQVKDNLRDLGSQVRTAATDQYDHLRQQATDYYSEGRARAEDFEHSLESYVQEKPIQSLLIAAGVGVLMGVLWKRS